MANSLSRPDQGDIIALFARAGYAARGLVYVLVGGLAALAALGEGGEATDSRGALESVLSAPLGQVWLGAMAIGLVGYAMWRCIQAIKDTDHHGTDTKGITVRASLLVSAGIHLMLASFVVRLIFAFGGSSGGSEGGSQGVAHWLMKQPYGPWLVGALGVILIAVGLAHAAKGWKMSFDRHLDMSSTMQRWTYPICRFGLATRGVIFLFIGAFFIIAAYSVNPNEAGGLAEVFDTLRNQPFGPWLLGFVATGLFAFGIYSLLESVYRRVNPDS
ncbi:DUF1206 domain-containing protein [Marinobacter sp. V034]|uniref:DUF1206 domain-containing protein n=1 Tax=Marinobacter sp. V034 TaxID=3459610 RepID=UPI004043B86D